MNDKDPELSTSEIPSTASGKDEMSRREFFKRVTRDITTGSVLSVLLGCSHHPKTLPDPLLEITKEGAKRIIFIPGIIHKNPYVPNLDEWKRVLVDNFPDREILFLDQVDYFHLSPSLALPKEIEAILDKGVEILSDGKETVILAHSFGGLLSKTIISRAQKAKVKKLITMATPHKAELWGLVGVTTDQLKTPKTVDVPTYTFGGYKDITVPFWMSKTENSKHQNCWYNHRDFLVPEKIRAVRDRIMEIISKELGRK